MANVRASVLADVAMEVPWWVEILNMSEAWNMPPWEIVWDQGKVLWVLRWRIYSQTIDIARRDKEKHN